MSTETPEHADMSYETFMLMKLLECEARESAARIKSDDLAVSIESIRDHCDKLGKQLYDTEASNRELSEQLKAAKAHGLLEANVALSEQIEKLTKERDAVQIKFQDLLSALGTEQKYWADSLIGLRSELRESQSQCAALREALEKVIGELQILSPSWKVCEKALSTTAGTDLLIREAQARSAQ